MRAFARTSLVAVALLAAVPLFADPEYPKMGPDIYDVHADGSAQSRRPSRRQRRSTRG